MRALAIALLVGGCYSPKIGEGDFRCVAPSGPCPSGFSCASDGHCYRSAPQFDMSMGPFVGTGELGDVDLSMMSGTLTLDAATGEAIFTDATMAMTTVVAAGASGFQQLAQPSGGPMVAMWNFHTLRIGPNVTVKPTGAVNSFTFAIALAATDTIEMRGVLYYNGAGSRGGSGTKPAEADVAIGAGKAATDDSNGAGGGGAGYGSDGMAGMGTAASVGAAGMQFGTPDIKPLYRGAGGGRGGAPGGTNTGPGGSGGGGVGLFATKIVVGGTIDVGGAKPSAATGAMAGGGGGGAGGSLILSGDTVTLEMPAGPVLGHNLLALGGAGGVPGTGGQTGGSGGNGRVWIGANTLTVQGGTIHSMPAVVQSMPALSTFPR